MWPLDLWGVCLDAKTPEKSPCDRSRTASCPSPHARQPGDHKGRAALDLEDAAQTSLGSQAWARPTDLQPQDRQKT